MKTESKLGKSKHCKTFILTRIKNKIRSRIYYDGFIDVEKMGSSNEEELKESYAGIRVIYPDGSYMKGRRWMNETGIIETVN